MSKKQNKKTRNKISFLHKKSQNENKKKLISGLMKYKPEGPNPQKPNNKNMTIEEIKQKKSQIGNSILVESSKKEYLHDLYNNHIIHCLPLSLKNVFKFERESTGKFFYNMTSLPIEIMKKLEFSLKNSSFYEENKIFIICNYEKSQVVIPDKDNKNENNNDDILERIIKSNPLQIKSFPINDQSFNVNNEWEEHFDSELNGKSKFYFNPFLQEYTLLLPFGAKLSKINGNYQVSMSKSEIWNQNYKEKLKDWMKRPARVQISSDQLNNTSYIEGQYEYNIWYDKYLTDRRENKDLIASAYKCELELDTGYTLLDKQSSSGYFCVYFAKGSCSFGSKCKYFHRVPTIEECQSIENIKDIFGRTRFATTKLDNGGVGIFTKEIRTLYLTNLKLIKSTSDKAKNMINQVFNQFGCVEDVKLFLEKAFCFVKFSHRCQAEFAKEAMVGQKIFGDDVLVIKWAVEEMMDKEYVKEENKYEKDKFTNALISKLNVLKNEKKKEIVNSKSLSQCGYGSVNDRNKKVYQRIKDVKSMNNNEGYNMNEYNEVMKEIEKYKNS